MYEDYRNDEPSSSEWFWMIVLLAIMLLGMLVSCKSKEKVVTEDFHTEMVDTTSTLSQVSVLTEQKESITNCISVLDGSLIIDFIEGGGTIDIDREGNVKATSVAKAKGIANISNISQEQKVEQSADSSAVSTQKNGVSKATDSHKVEIVKTPPWWQKPLIVGIVILIIISFICIKLRNRR